MASMLEALYLLISMDTSELKTGAKEVKESTKKVEEDLSNVDKFTNKVTGSFKQLAKQAVAGFAAIASIGAIVGGIKAATLYADRLDELSKALDVNIETLSLWGDAVQLNGGSVEGFQETVKSLTASLSAFATKGKSLVAPFFKELGVSMVDARGKARKVFDVLPELAGAFEKLSKAESFGIGQKLGLDQGTIMLLQRGRREVDDVIKRMKELGGITKEDAEIAAAFNDQWDYTAIAFRSFFTTVNSWVLPPLTAILYGFERIAAFGRRHFDFIIGGVIGIGLAISRFIVPALIRAAIAFAPFFLITAAIVAIGAAFALIYDDIVNFYKGNNSILGDLIKKWPILGVILKGIEDVIKHKIFVIKEFFNALLTLPEKIQAAFKAVSEVIGLVLFKIEQAYEKIINFFKSIGGALSSAASFFGIGDVKNSLELGQQQIGLAASSPIAAQTSNSIVSNSRTATRATNIQTGPITIETQATDADGIATAIGASMSTQMRQAVNDFDDGVMA